MLAAGLKGVEENYQLTSEATNNIYEMTPEERAAEGIGSLPQNLAEAIAVMEDSELIAGALGEHVFEYFIRNKRREWEDYTTSVTPWELNRYLGSL
jgi:glutamine synthetase